MRIAVAFLCVSFLARTVSCFAQDVERLPSVLRAQPAENVQPVAFVTAQPGTCVDSEESQPTPSCPTCCDVCPQCRCSQCQCPERPAPCLPCPRINLANPSWNLLIGGYLELDVLFNSARPVAPGVPFFLAPGSPLGFNQSTVDIHARQTTLYGALVGPEVGAFKSGGLILVNLFNDSVIEDRYGILPIQAYGELKNEDWRFAAGQQIDIFAPLLPAVLPFSYMAASGNAGVYRGQVRAERFLHPSDEEQWTITAGISDPIATTINNVRLSEDNGWPNVELRVAWAAGPVQQAGPIPQRPFEVGISAVGGQLRTINGATRVVANVWGLAGDFRWRATERFGFAGEVYTGQALGTYGAAVFQNVNAVTFEPVHVTGGWLETYYYLTPCLHSHVGYGIDDPVDSDLAASQIAFNRTIFANLIWDVTKSFRLAGEFTARRTNYITAPDNDGVGFQTQAQWKF